MPAAPRSRINSKSKRQTKTKTNRKGRIKIMAKKQVFCIATSRQQAETIVDRLQSSGFPTSEISILLPDTEGQHDIGHVKATKAPEGATTGVTAGGLTGGVLGLLAGIGALAIPGV